jgi:hypothetical protein
MNDALLASAVGTVRGGGVLAILDVSESPKHQLSSTPQLNDSSEKLDVGDACLIRVDGE